MWIEAGQLRHFRNYTELTLTDLAQKNIFLGENAAGKTNILEALYYLSHGRSPRTRHDRELIQWESPFATLRIQARSTAHGGTLTLEAQLTLSPETQSLKTLFKLNGNPVKNRSDIVGKLPTVTFFLSDLLMLRGGPEDRRSALDGALVQYDPVHFKRLSAYNRVRQQKSQLLKQYPHQIDRELLASLNDQLVSTGAEVMLSRIHYLQRIEDLAVLRYHELSHGKHTLSLGYKPSFAGPIDPVTRDVLGAALHQAIQSVESDERRRGQVLVGPHRDDIRFYLDGQDASHFGSQGQQRSIVLAIKLAEIQVLEQQLQGEIPVLLLDDVMAELDPTRQQQLLAHLDPRMQVFLTTTHLDSGLKWYVRDHKTVRLFEVRHGEVTSRTEAEGDVSHATQVSE